MPGQLIFASVAPAKGSDMSACRQFTQVLRTLGKGAPLPLSESEMNPARNSKNGSIRSGHKPHGTATQTICKSVSVVFKKNIFA